MCILPQHTIIVLILKKIIIMNKNTLQDLSYAKCISLITAEVKGGKGVRDSKGKFLCPIHEEKTPSFQFNESSDGLHWFYCYGCGKGGNMITFYKNLGNSYSEACKKLGIGGDERWIKEDSQHNLIEKVKLLMNKCYKELISRGLSLENKDIFVYQAPNKNFKTYYKCVFRGIKEKQPRFCFFNEKDELEYKAPPKQMPYNYLDSLEWKKRKQKNIKTDIEHRKIIITEGEKDVETIKNILQNYYTIKDEKYVPISFKGLKRENMEAYAKELFDIKNNGEEKIIVSVYFIGDNDIAGREYREEVFNACSAFIDHFYLIELPYFYRLPLGSDISDWTDYMARIEKKTLVNLREIFYSIIQNHHWDYKKSKCWAVFDEKDKPVSCWQNIASFFEFKKCNLRHEIISGKVIKDLGYLLSIEDRSNASHGICYNSLKSELYFQGLHIKRSTEIYEHIETYLKKRKFNEMLDTIVLKPKNRDLVRYNFSASEIYNFGSYYLSPLLHWLLNNIGFQSKNIFEIEFQKIMIFKILLACPYMLRNEGNRRLRGDLRFVSGNQKGKSTFCRELFGANLTEFTWFTQCTLLDVSSRDSKKTALVAPCVILDEGNLKGGKNTSIKEIRAFYDESIFSFIDKFEKNRTEIIRKSIIISSSNSKQNSCDIESERRLWQVEIESLPYLSHLKKSVYYSTDEQKAFWKKYNIHSDNHEAFYSENGEEYFKFPLIEFWREMNHMYEHYEDIIDSVIEFTPDQLKFYKECWMQGKYVLFDTQIGVEDLHAEYWDIAETVLISNEHFNTIVQFSKTLTPKDYHINKSYRALALSKNRIDIDPDTWVYCKITKTRSRGKKIPYISVGKANYMKNHFDAINQSMPFDPYQYCHPNDRPNNKFRDHIALEIERLDVEGFPKKNTISLEC